LNDAGTDGLHIDDILYLLGFNSKKELIPRLKELSCKRAIFELEGGRWKKNTDTATMNGTNGDATETFITPACKEDLPKIHLPGDDKFSSFKNTLQEFCQKKKFSVPEYKALRESNGLVGTVSFAMNFVRSTEIAGSVKEADARVAFEALRLLGYDLQEESFAVHNQLKRKDTSADLDASKVAKLMDGAKDPVTCKSKLNEYAQKKQISFAKYETVPVNGGFFSTVYINGESFKSMCTCKKRKESEQNAAQVALNALVGTPLPTGEPMSLGEADVTKMVSEARKAAQPVALKNRLQEYCQRMGKTLPVYDTKQNETDKTYQSTVIVQGESYAGLAVKGKKNAETNAAEVALKSLELMA